MFTRLTRSFVLLKSTQLLLQASYYTAAMLVVWLLLDASLSGAVWAGMTISQSAVTIEYCEFNRVDKFFHQPINTYSNLAYFFGGIVILLIARQDAGNRDRTVPNRMEDFPLLSALLGICFVYLSLGSAFFHASLTYVGQRVDMNGTYSILIALVGIGVYQVLHTVRLTATQKQRWVLVLAVIIVLFLKLSLLVSSSILVPVLILLLNGLMITNYFQFREKRSISLVIISFVLIVVAIRIRTLDVQKVGCHPHSLWQGHALWHLLTALSSFCSYLFFRSSGSITQPFRVKTN